MGLDMYAMATTEKVSAEVDFEGPKGSEKFHYWRKHPNLHGWMEMLYRAKGGKAKDFNGDCLALTDTDLLELEVSLKRESLPETVGFFFGQSDGSEYEDDMKFIEEARKRLAAGQVVYYTSWW